MHFLNFNEVKRNIWLIIRHDLVYNLIENVVQKIICLVENLELNVIANTTLNLFYACRMKFAVVVGK